MLKTLTESHKINWKDHIKKLTFTYNNRKNKTTGYSPRSFYIGKDSHYPSIKSLNHLRTSITLNKIISFLKIGRAE